MEGLIIKCFRFIIIFFLIISVLQTETLALSDTSSASVVLNADTLEVLYQNNPDEKRSMASTTKIMTGLLLAESGRLDEIIECTAKMVTVEGSALGLRAGDRITARDLLYGLMLVSGNDAANTAAYFLSGSTEEFANLMNNRAKELGLKNTNFVTPSGLDADEHYTTAYDLAVLTAHALKNEEFRKACSAKTATVSFGNPMVKYTVSNHNRLLKSYDGCIGVKTGYTKKSGRCLVSAAQRENVTVIAVTLNDPNDWKDHTSMLDYGFERLRRVTFSCDDLSLKTELLGGTLASVPLSFDDIVISSLPENEEKLELSVDCAEYLFAPVCQGQTVGKATVSFNGTIVAETDIYISSSVEADSPRELSEKEKIIKFLSMMFRCI